MTEHFDIIKLILAELNQRQAATILIKVKSHVGIDLDEAADVLANEGLYSETNLITAPERRQWLLWVSSPTIPGGNTGRPRCLAPACKP